MIEKVIGVVALQFLYTFTNMSEPKRNNGLWTHTNCPQQHSLPRHDADVCLFRAGSSISPIVCAWIRFGFQFTFDCGSRRTHIYKQWTVSHSTLSICIHFYLFIFFFFNRRFYHIRGANPFRAHQITTQLIESKVENMSCIIFSLLIFLRQS